MTDALRVMSMGKQYAHEIDRWTDLMRPATQASREERTPDEVVEDVLRKVRLGAS